MDEAREVFSRHENAVKETLVKKAAVESKSGESIKTYSSLEKTAESLARRIETLRRTLKNESDSVQSSEETIVHIDLELLKAEIALSGEKSLVDEHLIVANELANSLSSLFRDIQKISNYDNLNNDTNENDKIQKEIQQTVNLLYREKNRMCSLEQKICQANRKDVTLKNRNAAIKLRLKKKIESLIKEKNSIIQNVTDSQHDSISPWKL